MSENIDFHSNDIATKYDQTNQRNREVMNMLKRDVVVEHQPSSTNNIFPTYDPNTKMTNTIVVMPLTRDKNPPESSINPNDVQVSNLQMDFLKVNYFDKINISKETNKMIYSTLLKEKRENRMLEIIFQL